MTTPAATALIELALQAALADGSISNGERQILEGFILGLPEPRPSLAEIEANLQRRRGAIAELVQSFTSHAERKGTFEMCTAICAADGPVTPGEQWFLDELQQRLGLERTVVADTTSQVHAVTGSVPFSVNPPPVPLVPLTPAPAPNPAELEQTILHHALLAGGLELLPDTLAMVAILPVQMRLVYKIGKAHGFELDRGHIQEFLGVIGVGVATQMIEHYAARLLGGLAGHFLGGFGRALTGQATDSALGFATTYALGRVAQQYYAGGRRLGSIELRSLFTGLMAEAQGLQARYQPQIRRQGDALRGADLGALARGL